VTNQQAHCAQLPIIISFNIFLRPAPFVCNFFIRVLFCIFNEISYFLSPLVFVAKFDLFIKDILTFLLK